MPPRRESTPLSPTHAALGEAVRRLREARDWSQEELSDEADVHISQISGIERGTGNATVRTLKRVSDGLRVGLGEIWTLAERLRDEGSGGQLETSASAQTSSTNRNHSASTPRVQP